VIKLIELIVVCQPSLINRLVIKAVTLKLYIM